MPCLSGLERQDAIPSLTPYYVMRVGRVPVVTYHPPGDPAFAGAVPGVADRHHAVLLANHGPVVASSSLDAAVYTIEELEELAKLFLLLADRKVSALTAEQVRYLEERFPS